MSKKALLDVALLSILLKKQEHGRNVFKHAADGGFNLPKFLSIDYQEFSMSC